MHLILNIFFIFDLYNIRSVILIRNCNQKNIITSYVFVYLLLYCTKYIF